MHNDKLICHSSGGRRWEGWINEVLLGGVYKKRRGTPGKYREGGRGPH